MKLLSFQKLINNSASASNDESSQSTHHDDTGHIDLRDTQKYIGHIHKVLEKVPANLKIQSVGQPVLSNSVRPDGLPYVYLLLTLVSSWVFFSLTS